MCCLTCSTMDAARATGGKLLFSALTDGRAEKALALLGACCEGTLERTRAAYLSTADKALFASFPDRDWVILDREFGLLSGGKGALPLVQPAMFGPPERCFGHVQSSWPGLVFSDGKSAGFAFRIGRLFHDDGYADHRDIAVDALRVLSPEAFVLETNAPAAAELFLHTLPDGRTLLQLINLTGWNGMTMEKALPLSDIRISLPRFLAGRCGAPAAFAQGRPHGAAAERRAPVSGLSAALTAASDRAGKRGARVGCCAVSKVLRDARSGRKHTADRYEPGAWVLRTLPFPCGLRPHQGARVRCGAVSRCSVTRAGSLSAFLQPDTKTPPRTRCFCVRKAGFLLSSRLTAESSRTEWTFSARCA